LRIEHGAWGKDRRQIAEFGSRNAEVGKAASIQYPATSLLDNPFQLI